MKKLVTWAVLVCSLLVTVGVSKAAEPRYRINLREIREMTSAIAVITTTFGNIEFRFMPEVAPNHTRNFMKLAKGGFYNGTTFHRVIPGFMIQGGCPNSKNATNRSQHGLGGPGYTLSAEFNKTTHKRGIVSMARAQDPNSAGSQFFICVADSQFLDGQYTAFGEVIAGMDVVDKIVAVPRDKNDNPLERVEMQISIKDVQ